MEPSREGVVQSREEKERFFFFFFFQGVRSISRIDQREPDGEDREGHH